MLRPSIARRRAAAVVAVLAVGAGLAACSSSPEIPKPTAVADALASGIQSRNLANVPINGLTADAAQAQLETIIGGLKDSSVMVKAEVSPTTPEATSASGTLSYAWTVQGIANPWVYSAPFSLTLQPTASDADAKEWRVNWAPTIFEPSLQPGEAITVSIDENSDLRGDITGQDGQVLVTSRPVFTVGLDKVAIKDPTAIDGTAAQIATIFAMDPAAYTTKVNAAGPKAFVELITVRDDGSYADQISQCRALTGCLPQGGTRPLAPTRDFARPILGTTGEATAEIIEKSGGSVKAGDVVGLSGLQKQFDQQLRAQPIASIVVTKKGTDPRSLVTQQAAPPTNVATTLDTTLQERAESLLSGIAPASAIVAIRPSDGHILAAASGPGGQGLSTAMLGQYAPGSTFKIITSLAMLRSGYTPDTAVQCPETTNVDGRDFKNFPGYPSNALGQISMTTAVANSCNTAFIGQSDKVSQQALVDAGSALGVGANTVTDIGFDSFLGNIPADSAGTEHAASMIGQGKVLMSPLSMATVAASVAAGHKVTPMLITTPATAPVIATPAVPLTAEEDAQLQAMMRAVVTEGGATFLAPLDPPVMAKTGTAQFGDANPPETHTWMIGIQGDLAVAVFVDVGVSGAQTAGPILQGFLQG